MKGKIEKANGHIVVYEEVGCCLHCKLLCPSRVLFVLWVKILGPKLPTDQSNSNTIHLPSLSSQLSLQSTQPSHHLIPTLSLSL
jgi:hypothetical protein